MNSRQLSSVSILLLAVLAASLATCSKKAVTVHPYLILGTTRLSFSGVQDGPLTTPQRTVVTFAPAGPLDWSVSDDAPWLDVTPASANGAGELSVSVNTSSLDVTRHEAKITVQSPEADNSPQTIDVFYAIVAPPSRPQLIVSAANLTFEAFRGGALPHGGIITIGNGGGGTLNWVASTGGRSWLGVHPAAGNDNSHDVAVSVLTTDLAPGSHNATISISSDNADNSPQAVGVSYNVSSPPAHIVISRTQLTLSAAKDGVPPPKESFTITNSGTGTMAWSVADDAAWLDVSPATGIGNSQAVSVAANTTALEPGGYLATIFVSAINADNSPQALPVTYLVAPLGARLYISQSNLYFSARQNGPLPDSQTFDVSNIGDGTLQWSLSDSDTPWLDESPQSGEGNLQTVVIRVNTTGLDLGTRAVRISVSNTGLEFNTEFIWVTYTITP